MKLHLLIKVHFKCPSGSGCVSQITTLLYHIFTVEISQNTRALVDSLVDWCGLNHLQLNIHQTQEACHCSISLGWRGGGWVTLQTPRSVLVNKLHWTTNQKRNRGHPPSISLTTTRVTQKDTLNDVHRRFIYDPVDQANICVHADQDSCYVNQQELIDELINLSL